MNYLVNYRKLKKQLYGVGLNYQPIKN